MLATILALQSHPRVTVGNGAMRPSQIFSMCVSGAKTLRSPAFKTKRKKREKGPFCPSISQTHIAIIRVFPGNALSIRDPHLGNVREHF